MGRRQEEEGLVDKRREDKLLQVEGKLHQEVGREVVPFLIIGLLIQASFLKRDKLVSANNSNSERI